MSEPAAVLSGVTVIDLTRALAGPYCTMLLADMGADVIKVEPSDGDGTRRTGPFTEDDTLRSYGGYFHSVNRNKASIAVDLKSPGGRDVVRRLSSAAHVLVENYRPGVMDRLGLSFESLHDLNPGLVYACIRGFGDPRTGQSCYQQWPAFDVIAQAMGGLMNITGFPGFPAKAGPGIGDIFPAVLAALGIVAAVRHAERTGAGQLVDVAMYDAVLSLCERIVYQHSYTGQVPGQPGNGHPLLSPFGVFEAADGWVALAAPGDESFRRACERLGAPELAADPRFSTAAARVANNAATQAAVTGMTRQYTKAEIMQRLAGHVPCGPVNTVADIFADAHPRARGMLVEVEQPGDARNVVLAGTPVKFTATPNRRLTRAPTLGEHTDAILRRAGYTAAEISALRHARAVA